MTLKEFYTECVYSGLHVTNSDAVVLLEDRDGVPELWIKRKDDCYMIEDKGCYNDLNCRMDFGDEEVESIKSRWIDYIE